MSARVKINPGDRFNRLTVVEEIEAVKGQRRFKCRCDCGNSTVNWLSGLRSLTVKSCGCYLREVAKETAIKHFRKPEGEALLNELRRRYTQSARKRGLIYALTEDQFKRLVQHPCSYCGKPPYHVMERTGRYGRFTYTGIDRLDASKGYVPDNCLPCCKVCNYAKQTMTVDEFLEWVKLAYESTRLMTRETCFQAARVIAGS